MLRKCDVRPLPCLASTILKKTERMQARPHSSVFVYVSPRPRKSGPYSKIRLPWLGPADARRLATVQADGVAAPQLLRTEKVSREWGQVGKGLGRPFFFLSKGFLLRLPNNGCPVPPPPHSGGQGFPHHVVSTDQLHRSMGRWAETPSTCCFRLCLRDIFRGVLANVPLIHFFRAASSASELLKKKHVARAASSPARTCA